MTRRKPTEAEMDEFWSYVTGRQQERFVLQPGYFDPKQPPKTIPPENFTTNQEDQ